MKMKFDEVKNLRSFGIINRRFLNYMNSSGILVDIMFSDCVLIVHIGQFEGIIQEDVSTALSIDKAAIARSVKRLEKKGYICIEKIENDLRKKRLYLTIHGKEMYNKILETQSQWIDKVLIDFSDLEIQKLNEMLENIAERSKQI